MIRVRRLGFRRDVRRGSMVRRMDGLYMIGPTTGIPIPRYRAYTVMRRSAKYLWVA